MQETFDLGPQEWATLRRLLNQALELPADTRATWLDGLGDEFAAYRPRLAALLAHAQKPQAQAALNTLPRIETAQFTPQPGETGADALSPIGPYRLLRELGSGGMASVWLAERTDMLQGRQVALKLPHGAWRRAGLAERLQREREILATLEHPHIARLYDAGVAQDGQPYLALEYVHGERIDAYCSRLQLPLPQRLQLFLQVLAAVAHAHARLVVHRDLKPSNILVTEQGQVKLLDFGIAKLLDHGLADETALTQQVGRAFTPQYAAPEQIQGQPLSTAADIYALGVVLFELLCETRPYTLPRESQAALEEAVLHAEVPRPSSRVAPRLQRALRGDLDTIVLKALKKQAAERYPTAEAFADDVRRHLAHEPVLARPDSTTYRLGRLLARHRLTAAAAAAVLLAVFTGAGVAVWQSRIALAERDRATQVRSFIESIFRQADPYAEGKGPPTVAALLQHARQRVDRDLADNPALRVEMLELIGSSLSNMNENEAAAKALEEAVRLGREALGDAHPSTLQARVTRLGLYRFQGRTQDSLADLQTLLPALRASADRPVALVDALREQAQTLMDVGKLAEAQAPADESLKLGLAWLGERHPFTAAAAVGVALLHEFQRRLPEAKSAGETALRLAIQLHADNPRHVDVTTARVALGRTLGELGEYAAAMAQVRQAVADATVQLGAASMEVAFYQLNLAKFQIAAGEAVQALQTAGLASQTLTQIADPASHLAAAARARLGAALLAARRAAPAEQALASAFAELKEKLADNDRQLGGARDNLALAMAQQGRAQAALRVLDSARSQQPAAAPRASEGLARAAIFRLAGDAQAAQSLAREALKQATDTTAGTTADLQRMRALPELGLALVALGRHEEALPMLEEALVLMKRFQTTTSPECADVWLGQGQALLATGRMEQALAPLQRAVAFWQGYGGDARWLAKAQRDLARAQAGVGLQGTAQGKGPAPAPDSTRTPPRR